MKTKFKSIVAGSLVGCLPFLVSTAHAQTGTSLLAPIVTPTGGYSAAPGEYLIVNWAVSLSGSVYTYNYTVNNPSTDLKMTASGGLLAGQPESVDFYQVDFNTTVPGAYLPGTQTGAQPGGQTVNTSDLDWLLSPGSIAPGASVTFSFQSDFAPVMGNATAADSVFPSPWTSTPSLGGQQVPVPNAPQAIATPEPSSIALLSLAGLFLTPVRSFLRRK